MNKKWSVLKNIPILEILLSVCVVLLGYLMLNIYFYNSIKIERGYLLIFLLMFMTIIMVWLLLAIQKYREKEYENERQSEQIRQIEALYGAFRAERHDLINHVQTIYAFLSANKSDYAKEYLKELSQGIKALNDVLIKDNPSLSALLQVKSAEASRRGIELHLAFEDSLRQVDWSSTEANTVIGNIINNAMEALQAEEFHKEKMIRVRTKRTSSKQIELEISNNGPIIPSEQIESITRFGYSGKKGHSGIGLASVIEILEKMDTKLKIISNEVDGTKFIIHFSCEELEWKSTVDSSDMRGSEDQTKKDVAS